MSSFGKQTIKSLREFLRDAKAGKPIQQSIVRRMIVKGKNVYVHTRFKAPLTTATEDRGGERP